MKIELTEEQISLLKACTAAQQQLLSEGIKGCPYYNDVAYNQIKDCAELHEILTSAQYFNHKLESGQHD